MKYKIGKSKIEGAGKGLLVKKAYREGEIIGLAHIDDQPATSIGKFHNHSEEPTAGSIKIDNRRYLVAMRDLEPGDEITTDYRQQPELEQPEDFKRGGSTKLPKMPKPSKKGVLAKGYSRSLEATNRLFTENKLFARPKSKKRKVFDPNAKYYQDGGITTPEDYDQFKTFAETLPSNLQDPNFEYGNPDQYDLYGMWETVGKPASFVDVQDSEYFPLDEDGTYHGFTVGSDGTLLKPMSHSTTWKEVMNSQLSTDPFFQQNRLIRNEQGRLQYIPKAEYGMPLGTGMSQNYQGRRKFIHQDGGEPKKKKRKTDDYGRYRSEDGNVRTPITPEMQAVMPPDEWGQYVQDVPEVYTTRTKEQQAAMNAARNIQLLNQLNYQRAPHLYLPDGSLRPQAAQAADWFWQLGMTGPAGLEAAGSLLAKQIPKTGITYGTALNTAAGIHGATQVPQRIQDWQDVAAGKKDWREATAESLMTGLELYGGYDAAKTLLPQTYKINPWAGRLGTYNRVVGDDAIADLQSSGLVRAGDYGGVKTDLGPFAGIRTTPHPSFGKGAPRQAYIDQTIQQGKTPFIISTDRPMRVSNLGSHGKGSTMFPVDETGKYMSAFSADDVKVFDVKPHWLKGYKEVPKELPGSPNNTANIQKAGFLNPLELADAIVPNLDPLQVTTANSLLDLSPLNIIPIGKQLGTKGNAYRKFGNTMKYVQESKSLSPKGGILPRMGKQQIEAEGNWAALNEPWEKYPGAFTAEFDFKVPGSNLGYSNPSSRAGVLITDASGKALPEIPLTDPGLSFHRRLPFSNRYIPIDKQKLLDNKFQMATQGAHLQSLAEKYGYGLAYAGLLGAMGNDEAVKTYNKYTIDPVIKEAKKLIKQDSKKYQEGGIISQEEIDAGNRAMMKARLAYAQMHGNPAAQRMVVAPDQPYDFGNGMTGTHYMASMDEYAVPQIQEQNGVLELGDYSPNSNEAIRFDTPEDAEYFAENYKQVSPAFEAELTEEEIEEYRRGGWIVEEC
jgi:hypothetical protein